ncbi:hypothetical protein DS742_16805 [Lacrimispora amygdalina]|uniref:Uncharacterized protein n=1 Tax=Lacrimispora amygdalina TaxID=253257 RepID=A0A3E2NA02_9FIRM|nr:DUF5717 family protein [Clostridium indicum]RFZ77750.1 hypothetical protein DS742_16805 [Clostridium indicum]
MRERINRLAKGIIDSEIPKIKVTPSGIDDVVRSGGATRRELVVTSENNLHIKGLAYSSNYRVRMISGSFGGTYNHLVYEINGSFMEDGDVIKGSFYLVTNGGEKEVPYSFRVELGTSGKALSDLTTAENFADTAKKDMDTALRLFEYRDFVTAPFMNDLHVRAIYDGLKGRPDRRKELEEFLVALKVKKPVELSVDTGERRYGELEEAARDWIEIRRSCWGCISLEVTTDCDFIELPKKTIGEQDFEDDICKLPFVVHPERMHQGENYGRIQINGVEECFLVPVISVSNPGGGISAEDAFAKEAFGRFLRLRLEAETGKERAESLCREMEKALDEIELMKGESGLIKLLRAECCLFAGEKSKAALFLDESRDEILSERQEKKEIYCYYQYLRLEIQPDEYQRESLVRLMKKYLEEDHHLFYIFGLLLKTDSRLLENPPALLATLRRQYEAGVRSPFFYVWGCNVLNSAPELVRVIGPVELQILFSAAGKGLIEKRLASQICRLTLAARHYNRLHYRMLCRLYKETSEKEVLEAICSLLIKGECRNSEAFSWYEKGIRAGISLTRLYEYYIYALPKNYCYLLPKEVLLYFSYGGSELDLYSRSVLYKNVLVYLEPSDPLYQAYERIIEKFATEQLFESRIDNYLAAIYERMVLKEVVDLSMAKVLPSILRSYRVECSNKKMKYVIVCYEEMTQEDAFLLDDGVAYVPLFSEHSILLFQDAYGNRYANIPYKKDPVMERNELEERCFELYPEHSMLRLRVCDEILARGAKDAKEVGILESTLEDPNLRPYYQKLLLSRVIEYYQKQAETAPGEGAGAGYLLKLDKKVLTRQERAGVCDTLIHNNYMEEAYRMIRDFGGEGISSRQLHKLCTEMILKNLFREDPLLLHLAYTAFLEEESDSVLLDYLCEHYNGLSSQMYRILLQGVSLHVETYDLEERLTAQMMFSGDISRLDKVFHLYQSRKEPGESIVKAYFTLKCTDYFMNGKEPEEKVFSYLEGILQAASQKGRFPTIYLLALTRYYSELPAIDEKQEELLKSMVSLLMEERLVFPYYKKLAKYIPMPEDVMDKAMIQYCAERDSKIELEIRILPDEEEYHSEDITRMYQGVFVKQKILFEGEIMEYRVKELIDEEWVLKEEGSVGCEAGVAPKDSDSRYACLNEMSLSLNLKDETGLKKRMQEYLKKNAAAEEIFSLM